MRERQANGNSEKSTHEIRLKKKKNQTRNNKRTKCEEIIEKGK